MDGSLNLSSCYHLFVKTTTLAMKKKELGMTNLMATDRFVCVCVDTHISKLPPELTPI